MGADMDAPELIVVSDAGSIRLILPAASEGRAAPTAARIDLSDDDFLREKHEETLRAERI